MKNVFVTKNHADEPGQCWPVEILIQTENPADFASFDDTLSNPGEGLPNLDDLMGVASVKFHGSEDAEPASSLAWWPKFN